MTHSLAVCMLQISCAITVFNINLIYKSRKIMHVNNKYSVVKLGT